MNEGLKEAVRKYLTHQFIRALDDEFIQQIFELVQKKQSPVDLPCLVTVDQKTADLICQKLKD